MKVSLIPLRMSTGSGVGAWSMNVNPFTLFTSSWIRVAAISISRDSMRTMHPAEIQQSAALSAEVGTALASASSAAMVTPVSASGAAQFSLAS